MIINGKYPVAENLEKMQIILSLGLMFGLGL